MNEIRRNKLKERALSTETSKINNGGSRGAGGLYKRSQSFASGACGARNRVGIRSGEMKDENIMAEEQREAMMNGRGKRSNSANSEVLRSQIQQSQVLTAAQDNKMNRDSGCDGLSSGSEESLSDFRMRSQSLLPSKEILKRVGY